MPHGSPNSVMSDSQSLFGASAWKRRSTRLSGASEISPAYELYPLALFS